MQVLKYDWIGAHNAGVTVRPQEQIEKLGMRVLAIEFIGIADCAMVEVENVIDNLPPYIQPSDYKLKV